MIERFSTGTPGLDRLTDGGFLRGSAYIVQGPPGAGKTILANQFCYAHVAGGGRALYMSLLAESSTRMLSYVRQMAFFDEKAVPGSLEYISAYGILEREGLPGLLKLVQHELKRHNATAMVLDGTFVAQSVSSEQEFRTFIHALQGVAGMANAVLMLLTHQNRDASSPEHTMVDGWIEIRNQTVGYRSYQSIEVKKHRGSRILRGKHRYRISEQGFAVFPRTESLVGAVPPPMHPTTRVPTGLAGFDALIDGGYPSETSTLVLGPTGSGKTTLGMHFLAGCTPESPGLMIGFNETPDRLLRQADALGLDLGKLAASGALEIVWMPPADLIPDEVALLAVAKAKAMRAGRVFVDGLVALRDSLIDNERLPYLINALSINLHEIGATVMYAQEIREVSVEEAIMPSDELSAMVDNVVMLAIGRRHFASRRYLSVIKLREGDFNPIMQPFHIAAQGITFGPDDRLVINEAAV